MKRHSILDILNIARQRKIKVLTSYTANVARLLTESIADALLVGDSMGMVLYNMPSTHGVTLEMMIHHTKAVFSSTQKPLVIADMPFGTFEGTKEDAFLNASKLVIAGAGAVKLEGGIEIAETITYLVQRGIPVVGHVGLMPQKVNVIGGYGKIVNAKSVIENFHAVFNAGVFAVVLENIDENITNDIAKLYSSVLTIGIGAGTNCKGHVAVFEDMINLSTVKIPPFSHIVLDIKSQINNLINEYFESL